MRFSDKLLVKTLANLDEDQLTALIGELVSEEDARNEDALNAAKGISDQLSYLKRAVDDLVPKLNFVVRAIEIIDSDIKRKVGK